MNGRLVNFFPGGKINENQTRQEDCSSPQFQNSLGFKKLFRSFLFEMVCNCFGKLDKVLEKS